MSPLGPQRYSERLGLIEPDQLQEAADAFELGEVIDAWPASGGLFGQNIFLATSEGRFVLRGHPHGHVQLTKERCVARFIHEHSSLPAPWPYDVCDDPSLFGWTYAVMPMLPGTSGEELWATAEDGERVDLAAACGEALGLLHEAESEFFGPYDAQMDAFIELDDFTAWWMSRFEYWRNMARSVNSLSTEAELFIDDLLEQCTPALAEPFTPVLVHHDFKQGNVNFVKRGGAYEPSGVFDLFEAYLADGEEDLVRMLWSVQTDDERRAFVDAYTDHWTLRPGAADRLALYALSDWLVIWEYGKRHGVWFDDTTFMQSVRPILDNARAIASER